MKHRVGRHSKVNFSVRTVSAITNVFLAVIVFGIGAVCFLPSVSTASNIDGNLYYRGKSVNGVSLMINVYWGTKEVEGMLSVLEEYGAKATFFLGGSWADDNTECIQKIVDGGHEIGSHGYFHRDHSTLTYQENVQEIGNSVQFISLVAHMPVTLFAPPSGAYNDDTLKASSALGLKTVMWSRDTIDWRDKDESLCYRRATQDVSGGELILMHPMEHTLAALPSILQYYYDNGLTPITVSENIQDKGEE